MCSDITHIVVLKTLKKTIAIDHSDDSSLSSDEERPKLTPDATPIKEIFHTALQLRADLNDSLGHDTSWRGIDMEHISDVIPNSLYLELEEDNYLKVGICSIAQDIA